MIDKELLLNDLSVFSDLGVPPPQLFENADGTLAARLTRNGEMLILNFHQDGIVEEVIGQNSNKHASYKSLLASDSFGRLREWASIQASVLEEDTRNSPPAIPISGFLYSRQSTIDINQLDSTLDASDASGEVVKVMLIDGPAGIGKTEFIRQLTLKRAQSFKRTQHPLILHVQSRGRVLTFLQDLIAFSLQSLRLSVTFDQVPILVRNGLVTIAIDGFDELGDPAGYETAWAQLGDLITLIRGDGTLILAGRETFIGRERLLRDIKALHSTDSVDSLTLQLPSPDLAHSWLRDRKWSEESLEKLGSLFEVGAFSLRPIFLRRLGEDDVVKGLKTSDTEGTLSSLIDLMVRREATKFGNAVESAMTTVQLEEFVRSFLGEIARDMADNQSEAADEVTIKWAAEAAVDEAVPEDVRRLLQNRALVMAFLTVDERPRYRRFSHSQLQNYFLGMETVAVVKRKEVPKYLRRNLLGADFLITFSEVIDRIAISAPEDLRKFMVAALDLLDNYFDIDRGSKNLAALLLCCAPYSEMLEKLVLHNQHVDDGLLRGTAGVVSLKACSINQFDIRDADVSNMTFADCAIGGLLMNQLSKLNGSLQPSYVQLELRGGAGVRLVSDAEEIADLLENHGGRIVGAAAAVDDAEELLDHELFTLLERILRYRGYWIRENGDDILTEKIVSDRNWDRLADILQKHDFLRKEARQTSGRSSNFYHVRRPEVLGNRTDPDAIKVYAELLEVAKQDREAHL